MTKTIQFRFDLGGTLTDVTSVVFRDETNAFGVRRTDTLAVVVAANTALTHVSTGVYSYQFAEPAPGLNYEYWIEYVYAGNTKRLRQVLETGTGGGTIELAPTTYAQMGIDTVACGDSNLAAFLTAHANLIWAMQARRGVALDLKYQYFVSDLIMLAMDHVRMLIDTEAGDSAMTARGEMNALNTGDASSSTSKTRASSFTESSSSSQSFSRNAARASNASSRLDASNSSNRNGSSSDYSTMSQSASGSSERLQAGSSLARGTLGSDGTSGLANSSYASGTISKTTFAGEGYITKGEFDPVNGLSVIEFSSTPTDYSSAFVTFQANALGLANLSYQKGKNRVLHIVTPSTRGRVNPDGTFNNEEEVPSGLYSNVSHSDSSHGRSLVGSQSGSGSSVFSSSGTRTNNRTGSSTASANSATAGNSSSSMSSSSHEASNRSAASTSHSESTYNSAMNASSIGHRESAASDAMTATATNDREYYSQIFDSLRQMWEDTQEAIHRLEQQMMMTTRYLVNKLNVVTPQATLVAQVALQTDPSLIQRPGVIGNRTQRPFDRFIVR